MANPGKYDIQIQIDTKRHVVEVTNNLKSKFTVTSANIEVSGPSGGQAEAAQMQPFTVGANELKPVHSHELDDAVSGFRKKNPKARNLTIRIALAGTHRSQRMDLHATFSAQFSGESYEIDQYPSELSCDWRSVR